MEKMMKKAKECDQSLPGAYWNIPKSVCIQRSSRGLVPHQVVDPEASETPNKCAASFSQGGLSQEVGASMQSPLPISPQISISGSFYHDTMAMAQILSGYANRNNRVKVEISAIIRNAFKDAMKVAHSYFPMINQNDNEYLDLLPASDKRKKDIRIRAAGEPKRESKKAKLDAVDDNQSENNNFFYKCEIKQTTYNNN